MTSPPQKIEVTCPGCGQTYKTWHRASINFDLGETFDPEYLHSATHGVCPVCKLEVALSTLFARGDTLTFGTPEEKSQIIYLDDNGNPCDKAKATQARILEVLPDGSRRETYGIIERGQKGIKIEEF